MLLVLVLVLLDDDDEGDAMARALRGLMPQPSSRMKLAGGRNASGAGEDIHEAKRGVMAQRTICVLDMRAITMFHDSPS